MDQLSQLKLKEKQVENEVSINEIFPDEQLFALLLSSTPCYADIVNFKAYKVIPPDFSYQ